METGGPKDRHDRIDAPLSRDYRRYSLTQMICSFAAGRQMTDLPRLMRILMQTRFVNSSDMDITVFGTPDFISPTNNIANAILNFRFTLDLFKILYYICYNTSATISLLINYLSAIRGLRH